MSDTKQGLAKISWRDPETKAKREYILTEGATATIGRSRNNEICIPEQHVSRSHAVITHQFGLFIISDLGSANKTFVNDEQIEDEYPLTHGDKIRLYVPELVFSAVVTEEEEEEALKTGSISIKADPSSRPRLVITSGRQEGVEVPLYEDEIKIGRAVASATWEIRLEDRAVSRPHARIYKHVEDWFVEDLGSANKTFIGGKEIAQPTQLSDGNVISIGQTTILFRLGGTEVETATP